MLERMTLHSDELLLNQFDCPLLHMTYLTETIPSAAIRRAVSDVHEYGPTCTFQWNNTTRNVKEEHVLTQALTFIHDYQNLMFCLNTYCMYAPVVPIIVC